MKKISRAVLASVLAASLTTGTAKLLQASAVHRDRYAAEAAEAQAGTSGTALPAVWDPVEQGRKPTVKSQGSYGTCWALAAASALESSLLPGTRIEFSADHMALQNSFTTSLSDGGDYVMIMAYLSGWQGPVTEEEDPYGDGVSPDGLTPSVHVQEIRMLPEDEPENNREAIKEAIVRYGAVQTSLYMSREETSPELPYYQEEYAAYYYPEEQLQNHDIVILGWDDSYSREHFRQTPPIDGAFICQNSWGGGFGLDGLFYVSYADANLGRTGLIYSCVESTENYDRLYQTDDCGWQGQQGYASETCWFANVYTVGTGEPSGGAAGDAAEEAGRQAGELLSAVGFYATGADTSYELYLVRHFTDTESFSERVLLQEGVLEQAGYYTVELKEAAALDPGERFAVAVRITTPGADHPAAVEYRSDAYTQNVTTEGKEGYLSQTGERWEHTEEKFGSNVCLKAYTRNVH